ncbi:hypothetical protein [Streptomyces sp. NPDC002845]
MNTERPDNPDDHLDDSREDHDDEATRGAAESVESGESGESGEGGDSGASSEGAEAVEAAESVESAEGVAAAGASEGAEGSDTPKGKGADEAAEAPEGAEVLANAGAAKPRRRRFPVTVASVAAAVLLVGSGGAYVAATATGGSSGGNGSSAPAGDGSTPPPLSLDGYSEGGTGTSGIAPGEPDPNGVIYRAEGDLPDGPDSAPVYRAEGKVTKEEVARLAKVLGVEGTPVLEGEFWKVGALADGSSPGLQVNRKAPGTWTFSRYVPRTDNCQKVDVCAAAPSNGSADADPVSEAEAKEIAAPVLKAVGQDDAKLDASQVAGSLRTVNAEPQVGGLPTYGWTTGVQVGGTGEVVGGSGNLKAPVKGDTYPVIGAQETLDLLNRSGAGFGQGIGGCASPAPLDDEPDMPCRSTPKREAMTVEDATFGLATRFVDGEQALVPSWLFEVRPQGAGDSHTVTHPAVDPAILASPEPTDEPTRQPSPRPSGPGDEPPAAPSMREVQVEGYEAEGRELTVSFWGGVCSDYSASVTEGEDTVTVTVTETPWKDRVCILIAKVLHRTVQLDEPLGDRTVVGSDGEEIPEGDLAEQLPSAR